jgi:hypothetical protein
MCLCERLCNCRFVVRQSGEGFCHMQQLSCFGEDHGTFGSLMRTLIDRKNNAPAGSYTKVPMHVYWFQVACVYMYLQIHDGTMSWCLCRECDCV